MSIQPNLITDSDDTAGVVCIFTFKVKGANVQAIQIVCSTTLEEAPCQERLLLVHPETEHRQGPEQLGCGHAINYEVIADSDSLLTRRPGNSPED